MKYSKNGVLQMATTVMQDLLHHRPTKEIVNSRLHGDSQMFEMLSLFLYSNHWLTRQNIATEKGQAWIDGFSKRQVQPMLTKC